MTNGSSKQVVMIDTSCANVSSLKFAVERLGYDVLVTADTNLIESADKVLLPGVGSAAAAMEQIHQKGLLDCIKELSQPVFGICLGMQLMTNRSQEANDAKEPIECLGLVDTEVKAMRPATLRSGSLRLPHMGWNQIKIEKDSPLFHGIEDNSYFYFVHGYCVEVGEHTLASCDYTKPFSASIQNGNFMGVQFHPERSSSAGAKLLRNFVELV